MACLTLDVHELRTHDERRFQLEYESWLSYTPDPDWATWLIDHAKETWAAFGVHVNDVQWSGFHSQGDGLAAGGRARIHEWMEYKKLDEVYPALYLEFKEYGAHVLLSCKFRNNWTTSDMDWTPGNVEPSGVFQHLSQEDWDDLVNDQFIASDIEREVLDFVRGLCNTLYRELESEYESITSEEAFIESCELNEITFDVEIEDETTD